MSVPMKEPSPPGPTRPRGEDEVDAGSGGGAVVEGQAQDVHAQEAVGLGFFPE